MDQIKRFKLFNGDSYEYEILLEETEKGTLYSLHFSSSRKWTFPGDKILSILDTGNGWKLSQKIGKEMDYSFATELKILLNFAIRRDRLASEEYQVIELPEKPFCV